MNKILSVNFIGFLYEVLNQRLEEKQLTKKIMDLQDKLKQLFPDHKSAAKVNNAAKDDTIWLQDEPIICKFEKRNGKPITILEGYTGANDDFKALAKELKTKLSVGGSFKDNKIIIQGNYRDKIMILLQDKGFKVKRVGG